MQNNRSIKKDQNVRLLPQVPIQWVLYMSTSQHKLKSVIHSSNEWCGVTLYENTIIPQDKFFLNYLLSRVFLEGSLFLINTFNLCEFCKWIVIFRKWILISAFQKVRCILFLFLAFFSKQISIFENRYRQVQDRVQG